MKRKILGVAGILLFFITGNAIAQGHENVHIYYASLDKGEARPVMEFQIKSQEGKIKGGNKIEVLPGFTFQTIEGIGGAFNEIGGEALLSLDPEQQQEVMSLLFGSDHAGFSMCRTAVGSSDFGIDAYSYSEVPDDYKMAHFSIARDKRFVLPYLQLAVRMNPDLKIFASPWSPPGWMKENGRMDGVDYAHSRLRSEARIYQAYASYFAKYIKSYQENGVPISRLFVQNETDISTKYPSCIMPPEQLLELATDYIKPEFEKEHIQAEVWAGTFRIAGELVMHKYLMLERASELEGIGIQYTNACFLAEVQAKYPGFKFMHTEGICYNGRNTVEQAQSRLEEICNYINSNCTNYCYWNMILNETTESGWGWKQNSLINIDREKKTVQYNPDYNVLYLVSKFIRPGDIRVAATGGQSPLISVKDKNGVIKIIVQNAADTEQAYRLTIQGKESVIVLPARAISAIVIHK